MSQQNILQPRADRLQLLPSQELDLRLGKVTEVMRSQGIDALLVNDNVNLFYLTGRVFCGYVLIVSDGSVAYFVRRPVHLSGDDIHYIRKPEEMSDIIGKMAPVGATVGLMCDDTSYSFIERLAKMLPEGMKSRNGSGILREARAVKTPLELSMMEASGALQTDVYKKVPGLYMEGMSDIELQVEIERALRLKGCLGIFRTSGDELELFMGNVLTGENADSPSPYDFAMGGRGMDPSLPVGADGTLIRRSCPVMVDMNGNFNGYMTDMTRCYIAGPVPEEVAKAHRLSCDICRAVADAARPGVATKDLYELALRMATEAGLADCFMGHRQHAGFVGHGIGITVNEPPVLAPRSKDILKAGHTIAVEPKFVIPGYGAIGIENSYVICEDGPARCITLCPEEIMSLE